MELRQQLENFEQAYLRGEINALNISARFKKIAETILYGDRLPNPPYFPIMSCPDLISHLKVKKENIAHLPLSESIPYTRMYTLVKSGRKRRIYITTNGASQLLISKS